jgi:hypothetical protein
MSGVLPPHFLHAFRTCYLGTWLIFTLPFYILTAFKVVKINSFLLINSSKFFFLVVEEINPYPANVENMVSS